MGINNLFDADYDETEQLPKSFSAKFDSIIIESNSKILVTINDKQVGDIIDDNSKDIDFYRFHDVFHFTFATMLGWSPCTRSMLKRKRKSKPIVDEIEDGARATIIEEAILLIVFNNAKTKNLYMEEQKISRTLLNQIKEITAPFEVHVRTKKEWEMAILKGYSLFRDLITNNGGQVNFDMQDQSAIYLK